MANGLVCMPTRWFIREEMEGGKRQAHYYADACRLESVALEDGPGGYVVHEYDTFVIDAHELTLSLPKLIATFEIDHLPDPRVLLGQ